MLSQTDTRLIREAIGKLRLRLLDLTNRNRLLNFKFSETSKKFVRVVDEIPTVLFNRLTEGGARMYFVGLPNPPLTDDEATEAVEPDRDLIVRPDRRSRVRQTKIDLITWAQACGVNPSYELSVEADKRRAGHTDKQIQLLLLREAMDRKLSALREDANLAQQESGVSTLFVAFGFLEWTESESASSTLFAPLLLLPVGIGRELKSHTYRYYLEGAEGAEALGNISLRERLKRDFGLVLPEVDDEDDPESYLAKVAKAISRQPRWSIRRQVVVGHFSFARLAMYEDLGSERWSDAPLDQQQILHDLLSGNRSDGDSYAETLDVESPEVESQAPVLVTDADSSQFSAIVDAMQGRSFALKGPPGTGKSQTITNLIANLLFVGKRVLFVAEKLAALEVVSSRLTEAKLDPFILELHSAKAQKKQVLADIEARIAHRLLGGGGDPQETLKRLRLTRDQLRKYVEALNTPIGASGLALHDIYWSEQRARTGVPQTIVATASEYEDPLAPRLTSHDVKSRRDLVNNFVEAFVEATRGGGIEAHELYGIERPRAGAAAQENLRHALQAWRNSLTRVDNAAAHAEAVFKAPLERSVGTIDSIATSADLLPAYSDVVLPNRLAICATPSGIERLRKVASLLKQRAEAHAAASVYWSNPEGAAAAATELKQTLILLESGTAQLGMSSSRIGSISNDAAALRERLKRAGRTLDLIDAALPESLPISWRAYAILSGAINDLRSVPQEALSFRHDRLLDISGALPKLAAASETASRILSHLKTLAALVEMPRDPPSKLRRNAAILRGGNILSYVFSKSYRQAKSAARLIVRDRGAKPAALASTLDELASLLEERTELENDPILQEIAGAHFQGMTTNFKAIATAYEFVQSVATNYPGLDADRRAARVLLLTGHPRVLRDLVNAIDRESAADVPSIAAMLGGNGFAQSPSTALTQQVEQLGVLSGAGRRLLDLGIKPSVSVDQLSQARLVLEGWIASNESALAAEDAREDLHLPADRRISELAATIQYANDVSRMEIPSELKSRLLSKHAQAANSAYSKLCPLFSQAVREEAGCRRRLQEDFGLECSKWLAGATFDSAKIGELIARVDRACQASEERTSNWMILCGLFNEGKRYGVEKVLDAVWNGVLNTDLCSKVVELAYFRRLIREAESIWKDLPTWTGAKMEGLRGRLRELDKAYIQESRVMAARALLNKSVPTGISYGPAGNLTDKALLLREAGKQRRHIALRELLRRAGEAISALKPCYMMSPASVAQYLPPTPGYFDVVIIDEASQMRPEDAIGAAARGKQLIVVGDPQQLPPSTFFDSVRETEEEVDELAVDVELESILDLALGSFVPARDLRWHYRSRHQSLIAFSNSEFYDRRLIVFPSPADRVRHLGVSQELVVNGAYASSVNVPEAEHVLSCVSQLMRDHPESSIGVVSLNQPQLELLKEKFDQAFALDDVLEDYRVKWSSTLEPFFVKNLENVQGDERDIIVISTVYGPEQSGGPVAQRFGPINQKVGHRRLNVLFTRAKERVIVVTSMRPEDIRPSPTSSRGVTALKTYLEYSRSGRLEVGQTTGAGVESPFEAEVKELLLNLGYKVECQVGVAGFFIDLAVRHPVNSDHFMLGIECDGATYHSSPSARDRDRLRQEILERLHWKLHRIWSTDWFRGREREIARLKSRVEAAAVEN